MNYERASGCMKHVASCNTEKGYLAKDYREINKKNFNVTAPEENKFGCTGTSDRVIRLLNSGSDTLSNDPLYKIAEGYNTINTKDDSLKPLYYYNISDILKIIIKKIEIRNLKDYNKIYDSKNNNINKSLLEKYVQLKESYKELGFNYIKIEDTYKDSPYCIIIFKTTNNSSYYLGDGKKTLTESIDFLENQYKYIKEEIEKGTDPETISMFLLYPESKNILAKGAEKLGTYGKGLYYRNNNGYHYLFNKHKSKELELNICGNSLKSLFDKFKELFPIFDQKDKFSDKKINDIIEKYNTLKELNEYWYGNNNAISGDEKPSTYFNMPLGDTFNYREKEDSVNDILRFLSKNGNEWSIDKKKIDEHHLKVYLEWDIVYEKEGVIYLNNYIIDSVKLKYPNAKNNAILKIKKLKNYFSDLDLNF